MFLLYSAVDCLFFTQIEYEELGKLQKKEQCYLMSLSTVGTFCD